MKKGIMLVVVMAIVVVTAGCGKQKIDKGKIDLSQNGTKSHETSTNEKIIPETEDISDDFLRERYPGKEILHWMYGEDSKLTKDDIEIFDMKYGTHGISNEQVIELNDYLSSMGKDYVINFIRMGCGEEYVQEVKEMVAQGNAPDLLYANAFCDYDAKVFCRPLKYDFIKEGLLEELSSYMDNKLKLYRESIPDYIYKKASVNGKFYGIGDEEKITQKMYWYVNTDIAEKYDINLDDMEQMSYEDWAPYFAKVYEGEKKEGTENFKILADYPCEQNEDTTFGYIGEMNGENYIYTKVFGENEEKGIVENYYASDSVKNSFKNYADYYKKGYFSYLNPTNKNEDNINSGNCFAFLKGDYDEDEVLRIVEGDYSQVKGLKKIYYCDEVMPYYPFDSELTGICSASQKKEMALDALNTIYSDRVASNITSYPLYKVGKEDFTESFSYEDEIENYSGPIKIFSNPFARYSSDYHKEGSELKKEADEVEVSDKFAGRYFDYNNVKKQVKKLKEIEDKYIDDSAELKGEFLEGDFEMTWNRFLKELDEAGIDEAIKCINEQLE